PLWGQSHFDRRPRAFGTPEYAGREQGLPVGRLCRCAFWLGFRLCFLRSLDFRSSAFSRVLQRYLLLLPEDYVQLHSPVCFHLFPLLLLLPGLDAQISSQVCFHLLLPLRSRVPAHPSLGRRLQSC